MATEPGNEFTAIGTATRNTTAVSCRTTTIHRNGRNSWSSLATCRRLTHDATSHAAIAYDKRVEGCTVYYGRDRGEKNVAGVTGASLAEVWPGDDTGTEYTYVWRIGEGWLVGDADEGPQSLQTLAEVLAGGNAPKPNIKAFGGNFVIGTRK